MAPSKDVLSFMNIVSSGISPNVQGNLEIPLTLRDRSFPNNYEVVNRRMQNTLSRLKYDPEKLKECTDFMGKSISAGHVEIVPDDELKTKKNAAWWIPVFYVLHKQTGKLRLVFDSSASFEGVSLNSKLYQGPDQNNRLVGVLLRFREGEVGFVSDIEKMYHSFYVKPEDRDFMRFFWFRNNDPSQKIVQYRANVHIFGNTSSPSIAIFALRYATMNSGEKISPQTVDFIHDNFYTDDGLGTAETAEEAINILQEAKSTLGKFNIKLHKISSSSPQVVSAFPSTDRAPSIEKLEFTDATQQRTLGLIWHVKDDKFSIVISLNSGPFTKRYILSTINSIFDPLGLIAPIVLTGRLIQRKILPPKNALTPELEACDWDDPLPKCFEGEWDDWKSSLKSLETLKFERSVVPKNFGKVSTRELHAFCDASESALGIVIYVRVCNIQNMSHVSLLCASSKLAPRAAVSVPRLELCAALELVLAVQRVSNELKKNIDSVTYYSDSKVVLDYLKNSSSSFTRYVSRRVQIILSISSLDQWRYIRSGLNPADIGSRPITPVGLSKSVWVEGPIFLRKNQPLDDRSPENVHLPEVVNLVVSTTKTKYSNYVVDTILENVNNWNLAVRTIRFIFVGINRLVSKLKSKQNNLARKCSSVKFCINYLISESQKTCYNDVLTETSSAVSVELQLPERHRLACLSPFIDKEGILRVGGRLLHSQLPFDVKCPVLLPPNHRISTLVLRHYHELGKHQGRYITHGALREAGYHLEKGSKAIKKYISSCVICRKTRAPLMS